MDLEAVGFVREIQFQNGTQLNRCEFGRRGGGVEVVDLERFRGVLSENEFPQDIAATRHSLFAQTITILTIECRG